MQIGVGGVKLGSASSGHSWRADVRLVHEAVERGVTLFDTADAYGSGASERVLGRALAGRRAGVAIATKGGYRFRPRTLAEQTARRWVAMAERAVGRRRATGSADGGGSGAYAEQDFSVARLREAVEASLRRLRTDHIDVYQLHGPPEVMPSLLASLGDLVQEGKVGRLGVGAESVDQAKAWVPVPDVSVVQLPFGILDPEAADEVIPLAATEHTDVWVRGVLGGGLLAAAVSDSTPIHQHPKSPLVLRLQELASRWDIGLDHLAVGFVQSCPGLSAMLVGISTTNHLHRYLDLVAAGPLDANLLDEVRSVLHETGAADG